MTDLELIRHLSSLGVRLWVEGDALKFSAPRGVLTDELKERLRARKDEIRDFLKQAARVESDAAPPLVRVPREGALPLSFGQERLWFLAQLEPDSAAYLVPSALRLDGPLDADALARALEEIVRRHEVLRTSFPAEGGRPVQVVHPAALVALPIDDLSGVAEADRDRELRARLDAETRRSFDLASSPLLLRARLFRFGPESHVLALTMHHIISDGWSNGVLSRELGAIYEAFTQGRPSPLPELPIQYADYAAWQRAWLAGDMLERQLAYWKKQLAGAPALLELPTDRPRPPAQSYRGGLRRFRVGKDTSDRLAELARREGATLFMVLLAAFDVLLARWSGQDDIVVGSPIAGRARPETEPLIGFFINTLALRTTIDESEPFRALLARVKQTCLGAYAHQDIPFERLVSELAPERDPSRQPIFQALFALQNAPREVMAITGTRRRGVSLDLGTSKFDLSVPLVETPEGIFGGFEYASDLFDPSTIDRMCASFTVLLDGIAADPGREVASLPVLGEAEFHRVLVEWNATAADFPTDRCAHHLFEDQVKRTPDAVAVTFGDAQLTYRELDERANQVAQYLVKLGVGPDVLVGLCVERSLEMAVGVLGVLKAGGAYVPLDPSHPLDRLAWMLEDSAVPVVLTQEKIADELPASAMLVRLDADWPAIEGESGEAPATGVKPENLAYIIYTSGSTGKPKGVMIHHRGLVNYVWWASREYDAGSGRGAPVHSSIGFDLTVTSLWTPLLTGTTVVFLPEEGEIEALVKTLVEPGSYSLVKLTPAHLEVLNQLVPADRAAGATRAFIIGGEALSWKTVAFWRKHAPNTRLINEYGPTETVVGCSIYDAAREGEFGGQVSIGRPIANTQLYILDKRMRPVPIGVVGELYIGGTGVARGYLNRPELTAERFLYDPFSKVPGARLYKTGDLARYLPSGDLEFLGRADFQVKIRGYRIELGEIEAVLAQFPGVSEAVVIAREDKPGDKRLVAYLVAAEQPAPPTGDLRAFLGARVPEYMVPTAFVRLDAMPLTGNGKIDRRALPSPEASLTEPQERVAPRGPVEEVLAGIFADVLNLSPDRVSAHDGFFELGGHSLLATRAVARVCAALGVELPLRALFEAPSVSALAARVSDALAAGGAALPPLERAPADAPRVLSFAQDRLWFIDQLEPGDPSYIVPMAMRLSGALDTGALERALHEVVRRHQVLRTTYAARGGEPASVVHPEPDLALPVTSWRMLAEPDRAEAVRREIAAEARRPFDLAAGPLLRARLFELQEDDHLLLVSMHHIVTDAWSLGVLNREITALYDAFSRGEPSPLPELPIQYADFAAWQRAWLSGDALDAQLAYWKERLAGAPRALDLVTDRPRPPVMSHRGSRVGLSIPADVSAAIDRLARSLAATPFMVLLAAFDVLLHRYTGQDDIVVGTPIAGRTRAETEGLIGFFVNTLALRAQLSPDLAFTDLVARVRETSLGAYAHQDLPFERLVLEIEPERDMSRTPLFQVAFAFQNAPREAMSLTGLKRRGMEADSGTSKFDLTMVLVEGPRGIAGSLEYASDLFDRSTVERLAGHYATLIASIAAGPERRIADLSILGDDERRRVVEEWNATRNEYPRDATIDALFAEQAARSPDAVALIFGGERLTYAELDRSANRLAHHLVSRGVSPGDSVALYARRSIEMVVATLAILKAGAAYVPLDPDMPDARLAWTLADAGARVVIAAGARADRPLGGAIVVDLEADAATIGRAPDHVPPASGDGGSFAYIMYTSGSTGRPKGVCVVHRGVVRLVKNTDFARIDAGETFLQLAPIAFDAATLEIWGPLLNGGKLVIFPPEPPAPDLLGRVIRDEGVTTLWLTAGLFNTMIEASPEVLRPLRQLLAGGEALSVPHVQKALAELPGVQLINGYGPTENTTFTCCHPIAGAEAVTSIPIGRPIANTQVYVLDERLSPVPVGVPGELYIGGDGLARGYLNRPELDAERFVRDPFHEGERLYKTGDRVRWLPDGTIAFLGRLDFQVKLRGFRIELGEIEAVLGAHSAVGECVVIVREDVPGDRRLVGYLASSGNVRPTAAELRAHLKERLPEYMVPAAFVVLEALPLTVNGKVDRRALPAPEGGAFAAREHVAPRGPIEETLAGIYADVLRVPAHEVGAHDGFFDLGGHSLRATQAITRIRAALGVDLPLRALFEAPRVADLAARIEAALKEGQGTLAPPIVPVPRAGAVPLSFAQERLWFLHQLDPADPSYGVPLATRFEGSLDEAALTRALDEIVRRHEILRTTYVLEGGRPMARVQDDARLDLVTVLLAGAPDPESELRHHVATESRLPFDLERGPVIRARLFTLSPDDHVLLVAMHHIVSDGWSMGVLNREIGALYDAFAGHPPPPPPLPELPVQYADYAAWQRALLAGEVLDRQLAYWKARLGGAPRALDLPTDRPRPPVPSHRGALRFFELPEAPSRALADLARREGATLFMVLLSAFEVLLHRWSGQETIVVGTPIANRTRAETEGLIGFFVNTLVLRADLDPEESFLVLLRRVREGALGAYAHQDTPFERLVQEIEPDRDMSRTPLFQVMFALQNAPMGAARLSGLKRRGMLAESGTSKFDVTLNLVDGPRGITGAMEYATDLFDAATVDCLLAGFGALCTALAERADRRLWELPVLPAGEEQRILARAGGTAAFPVNACLHELFAAQVELSPDAIAVTCEKQSLSYRELDRRANQVANALQKRGVGPDTLVGLCVDRSLEMIVGLIGILKAGGAYLPLDPDYPKDRLAFMIEDARVPVVLTQARHAELVAFGSADVIRLDTDWPQLASESVEAPPNPARPEHLAYVIYTSGSTGKPKGAMVEHRNVVRLFTATERWYRFDERDVWTMFHSYAFDFSVWEIWGALLYGGRVVIVPYWVSRSPEAFYRLCVDERVTVLNQTPSAFRQFVRAEEGIDEATRAQLALRYVIFGGEALDIGDLAPFWDRHGDEKPRLVNMYGITETTVHVTYRPVSRADLDKPWSSVIGVPIPDLAVHILDAHRQPVPVGVPGEMYVGGAGVARGYLHRPELSTERFLADPFHPERGGRLYKTGDLARYVGENDIEYLGRIDHQVKIRGFRIELGEIEAALDQHAAVREAVVLAREDVPGDKRLVAYLVCAGAAPVQAELRAFLKERLPEYMVPAAFVVLPALPLTSNGKVDRRALPVPEAGVAVEREYVAPRGPVEEAVAGIFAEVLGVARVGAHDGFFELGGHSLLATQAIARVRAALGVDLPLRALFEAPTPAELAPRIEAALREGGGIAAPIPRIPREGSLPTSFGQERLWVLHQLEPDDPSYIVPLTLRITGALDAGALERVLREIVRRHEILRTTYAFVDGHPAQIVHDHADLRLPVEDLRSLPEREREALARRESAAEARRPFDLAGGPVIRARLLALADDVHLLLLTAHHIVADAWSTGVILRELSATYDAFRDGRPSPLSNLPIQYADYAAWQRRWFTGDVADRQLAYWKARLDGASRVLDLPIDRPRPPVQSHRGARRGFTLSKEVSAGLEELSRREGATLFMTLLAAIDVLLHRHTGQEDLSVGTPIANRGRAETEGLVGFFLNTLVLRAEVSPDLSFRALLARVRETCLGAYAHQDMPFERLVTELDPERDLSRSPLFQVLFTLQDAGGRESASAAPDGGLKAAAGMGDGGVAKFDLSLAVGRSSEGILAGSFEYATDLFDASTIERFVEHLRVLLDGVVAHPGQPLHALPLLPDGERVRVLCDWNDTGFRHPDGAFIHEVFAAQAASVPDAPSLAFEGTVLRYRDLDARTNQLAHALRKRGVGPEVLVGVCMERSIEMVVALYGVLKAGGAYVPLDPEYPRERLAFMLEDAKPRLILTQARLAGVLPDHGAEVIALDTEWSLTEDEPLDPPDREGLSLSSLAYVIYTSGSTGRPKGAMNEHRGILNRLSWMQHAYGLGADDRVLQKTPFSFDVSVWEFFWPLMFGAQLVVARPGGHREPGYLADLIEEQGITTLHFVPSMLKVFLDDLALHPERRCRSLRRVMCSGEALPSALAARFFALLPGVELHNLYGPTEAAVDVTALAVRPDAPVTIGRPIHNTRIYLLDAHHEPVPIGVRGELYIGGVQVGRGYLNRAELTAQRFVKDPFAGDERARMYRTGDVARWLSDGQIEYLGRADFQVKLRGFRIELGEIESTLLGAPAVREAVVMAREDVPGSQRLVAYLVCAEGMAPPTVGELRAFLGERLPEYMIPSAFVLLPSLPLTASGKVDRRALPAPDLGDAPELGEAFVAPENRVEEELAGIWAGVLRRENIGVRDNFFAIGGDSILAIQIVTRAQAAGIRITPRQIFQHPTIAELAGVAGTGAAVQADQGPVTGKVIATPIQRWWFEEKLADAHHYNQSFFFEVKDRLDAVAMEGAVEALLAHHDMLRLRAGDGTELRIVPVGDPAPLWKIDLEDVPEPERRPTIEQVAAEAQASLDLSKGPVARVVLFDLGSAAPSRLLVVIHHLAVDGVSWRFLLEDLWSAYAARREGRAPALPPKTTAFQRWAEKLAEHAGSAAIAEERTHWLSIAEARVPVLPVDRRDGEDTGASAQRVIVSLSESDTEALLTRVPEVYRTQINDVLLTALAMTIGKWTAPSAQDAERLLSLVDLEGHGREELFEDVDLTRTAGWFTTLFPVLLEIAADAGPGEALKAVKEQLRAIPGRGLGYGLLRYLGPDGEISAELARMPRPEVSFNYLGQFDQAVPREAPVRAAREHAGASHAPRARRSHLLDITASVAAGRLTASFVYSENRHDRRTVEELAEGYADALRALIDHCLSPEAGGATPSDFDKANLSQDAIDMLAGLDPNAEASS